MALSVAVIAFAACLVWGLPAAAQSRTVLLTPDVRVQLEHEWDNSNAQQWERAYCLAYDTVPIPGDSAWVVYAATRVVPPAAGPTHVYADCGPNPVLHIHTPTTCAHNPFTGQTLYVTCRLGGPGADIAYPSPADAHNVYPAPFGIIQSGRHTFTAIYPR